MKYDDDDDATRIKSSLCSAPSISENGFNGHKINSLRVPRKRRSAVIMEVGEAFPD